MILDVLLGGKRQESGYGPTDDFWYTSVAGTRTNAGVNVNETTAFTYSVCWAATRLLSGTVGALPLNLYRLIENDGRTVDQTHAVQRLLHTRPNYEMTAFAFRALMTNWQINCGNAFAEIQWLMNGRGRTPAALWPIHPSRVKRVMMDDSDEWLYEVKNKSGVEPTYIKPADMLHVPNIITDDGVWGKGVIQHARETIGSGLGAEREASMALGTRRVPTVVVETPKKMNPVSRDAFRKEWREIHQDGGSNVALLDEGAAAKALAFSAKDSQYLESRQFTVEEMARWYGIPPHMLQHLLGIKYNSAEQLGQEFVTYTLMPYLVPWEQECGHKLLSEDERTDRFVKFVVLGLLRGDSEARQAFYASMITHAVYSPNDVLRLEDMNPVDGGDRRYIQGAMVPLGDDGLPIAGATASDIQRAPAAEPANDAVPDEREQRVRGAARAMLTGTLSRMVHKEATAAKRAAKKPNEFLGWLDEFYAGHAAVLAEALIVPCDACAVFGLVNEPNDWARRLCDESRERLLVLTGDVTPDKLSEAVDALMADWQRDRANGIVREIVELN